MKEPRATQPTNRIAGKIQPVSTMRACMILTLALLIVISIPLIFFWYMSPLGMGFHQWPEDREKANQARSLYLISLNGGIPLLIFGQLTATALAFYGRVRMALALSAISLTVFLTLIGYVLWLI
ncbi:hypothetical protein Q0601_16465 [Paracoccus onubensis]|uniref:hypothetical protein n=1 Tax=Paracoccus onubensis TaxID=1675788 RepID=UPI002730ED82|nr:hypothetical protein [Paracoccus onubensis]MDP0928779.1 hypothetical protein [Paracoccus onubensis]